MENFPQHNENQIFVPIDVNKITKKERSGAFRSLMSLTEKQYIKIQARKYADNIKQHETINKDGSSYPTVTLDVILITLTIKYHKESDVATIYLPGSYELIPL